MNSRRRLATYERVNRKADYSFKYSTPYLPSDQALLTIPAKGQVLIQEDGHIPAKLQAPSPDSEEVKNAGNDSNTKRCTRSMKRMSDKAELKSKHLAARDQPSLDMLSSECESLVKHKSDGNLLEQKGGREHDSRAEGPATVCDNPSESRISAFRAISQHRNILKNKRPSSEALQNNQEDQRPHSPSAISHSTESETKGSGSAELVSSEIRSRHRLPAAERNQKQKVADLGMYSHQVRRSQGENSSADIKNDSTFRTSFLSSPPDDLCSISPRPLAASEENPKVVSLPQRPAQLPGASSSHQRELWDALLNGDGGRKSSAPTQLPNAIDARGHDIGKSRSGDQRERCSQGTSDNQGRKRRRLVDHLTTREIENNKIDASLIDQHLSFKGSSGNTILQTSSLAANSSSCESQPLITPSQDHDHSAAGLRKPSMPLQGGRLKVTYARQRSFVNDDASGAAVDTAISTDPPRLQATWESAESDIQIKLDENSENLVNSQSSTMRSIYELRKAGSNARTVSNMEAVLDDIKGETGVSLERKISKLLELILKLQDMPYCRLFIEQALDLRLLSCLDSDNSTVVKALVGAAILHLLAPSNCLSKLYQTKDPRLSKLLLELLDQDGNLKILVKKAGFMKPGIERENFEISWENLIKSAAWGGHRPLVVTARAVGLRCLEHLARHTHDSSQPAGGISPNVFWKVAQALDPKNFVSVHEPNPRSLLDLQLALSILEIYTIGKGSVIEEMIWRGETIEHLKSFLPRLSTWREDQIGKLKTLTLRLYLNLMNNRPKLCEAFATTDNINTLLTIVVSNFRCLAQESCDDTEVLLDNLILALGSMINLAEWCPTAPQLIMSLRLENSNFLDVLLALYKSKQAEAQEVSQSFSDLT